MPHIKNTPPSPTIKGLFVNSHVSRLRQDKGEAAVQELERQYGSRVVFKALEDVPVREEIKILGLILDQYDPVPPAQRDYEAGRLHYRNFSQTGLGQTLLASLPHTPQGFKTLVLNSGSIGRSIFKHTNFYVTETPHSIGIRMENTDYTLRHFEAFFGAWAADYGVPTTAITAHMDGTTQIFTISGL